MSAQVRSAAAFPALCNRKMWIAIPSNSTDQTPKGVRCLRLWPAAEVGSPSATDIAPSAGPCGIRAGCYRAAALTFAGFRVSIRTEMANNNIRLSDQAFA